MSERDDKLDELLARGRLGGPARERILERAIASASPRPSPWRRRAFLWLAPAMGVATAAVVLASLPRKDGFVSRGGAAAPLLSISCDDAQRARCATGRTVLFEVDGAREGGVLAAFAERTDGSGERIWYFPAVGGGAPAVPAMAGRQVLPKAVRIGSSQPPGSYLVHLVLLRRPLAREQIVDETGPDVICATRVPLEVTP